MRRNDRLKTRIQLQLFDPHPLELPEWSRFPQAVKQAVVPLLVELFRDATAWITGQVPGTRESGDE